jgi:hypothetical protein
VTDQSVNYQKLVKSPDIMQVIIVGHNENLHILIPVDDAILSKNLFSILAILVYQYLYFS